MKKRHKISRSKSRKVFTRTAKSVHPRNHLKPTIHMRGGIRL